MSSNGEETPDDGRKSLADLASMPVEELLNLQEWLIPLSRSKEVQEHKDKERRRQIKKKDELALEARWSKPGERLQDHRGFWPTRGSDSKTSLETHRSHSDDPQESSSVALQDPNQLGPRELRSRVVERSQRIQREHEEEYLKDSARNTKAAAQEPPIQNHAPQTFIEGLDELSISHLGDLILSSAFERLDGGSRTKLVARFLELYEAIAENNWKALESTDCNNTPSRRLREQPEPPGLQRPSTETPIS